MKRILMGMALAGLALLLLSSAAWAQDERPKGQRGGTMQDQARPGMIPPEVIMRQIEQLDLSAEQKEKIATLRKAFQDQRDETMKKVADLQEQMKTVREAGDKEKVAELEKQRRDLSMAQGEKAREFIDAIKKLLKPEQLAKLEELIKQGPPGPGPGNMPGPMLVKFILDHAEDLKLTDDEKDALKKLAETLKPAVKPGENAAALREKIQKMKESGATEEEIRKVTQEAEKGQAEARAKTDKECREVINKILTKEQQDQVVELLKKQVQDRGRGAGAGPGPNGRKRGGPGGDAPPPPPPPPPAGDAK